MTERWKLTSGVSFQHGGLHGSGTHRSRKECCIRDNSGPTIRLGVKNPDALPYLRGQTIG